MKFESSRRTAGTIIIKILLFAAILSFLSAVHIPAVIAKTAKENLPKPYVYSKGDSDGLAGYKFKYKRFQDYEDNESNDMLGGRTAGVLTSNGFVQDGKVMHKVIIEFLLYHLSHLTR